MSFADLRHYLGAVRPGLALDDSDDPRAIGITVDGNLDVHFTYVEKDDEYVLVSVLAGALTGDSRLFRLLLTLNLERDVTHNAVIGIDDLTDTVVVKLVEPRAMMTQQRFAIVLERFIDTAMRCRSVVEQMMVPFVERDAVPSPVERPGDFLTIRA